MIFEDKAEIFCLFGFLFVEYKPYPKLKILVNCLDNIIDLCYS